MTIGVDLGDRRSHLCVVDARGEARAQRTLPTTQRALQRAFAGLAPSRVVMEVGTHSPWVSRLLGSLGHEVIVANARAVRSIAQSRSKNDAADAEQLARLGRADPQLLRPIRHRSAQAQRDRALLGVRDGLVRARTALINQARGSAKALGHRLPRCTSAAFAGRIREKGLADLFPGLETLVDTIAQLTAAIRAKDREIARLCEERYPETELLRQVAGVGPITALAYVLTLEDPHRFAKSRSVGAYLGLCPAQRQSGERDPELRITKQGDVFLRRMLIQASHYILGPFGPDTDLRRFGTRLIARGGRLAKKKARVAVARKLAVLLHSLWRTAEVYEPLRQVA
jgi:transposase